MPRPPKLTNAQLARHHNLCPRKSCDGFLCTVGNMRSYWYRKCNDCNRFEGWYHGVKRVTREEYDAAMERNREKMRRSADRALAGERTKEEGEAMAITKVKAKGKKVAKGSKKKAVKKAVKDTTARNIKPGPGREGTKRHFIVSALLAGKSVEQVKVMLDKHKAYKTKNNSTGHISGYKQYLTSTQRKALKASASA